MKEIPSKVVNINERISGIRPIDFLGNFYMTNATEMIFGTIDSDKSVAVELKHDDKLPVESNTYIQVNRPLLRHISIASLSNRLHYSTQVSLANVVYAF